LARGQEGFLRIILLLLLAILAGTALVGFLATRKLQAEGPLGEPAVIWVERGDSLRRVEEKLAVLGAIDGPGLFYYYGRATGLAEGLRAGEFEVPAGASLQDIAEVLAEADPILRFVTIPEGVTVAQAMRLVEAAPMLKGDVGVAPPEGTMLPETYAYERGETREALVARTTSAHQALVDELWPNRAADLPVKTKEEAVILASIVEKETAVPEERPRVAAVFTNRLRRGMRLQSDPTIIYGVTGGEPMGRGIRRSELANAENPYNTYRVGGLPPTPIANPGRESLAAVLNPADTNDLYFVADGTGGHAFAATLREHNANVARWRAIERARKQGG
jgi:UPF0755 protein